MKKYFFILAFFSLISVLFSQQDKVLIEGEITYISSQNIYVKFKSTSGLAINDTLFIKSESGFTPAIFVKYISSKSCSGSKLLLTNLKIGDLIFAFARREKKVIEFSGVVTTKETESKTPKQKRQRRNKKRDGDIFGRFSIASYGNISSISNSDYVRWRYTFSAQAQNFKSSNFSFDTYISFNYRSTEWSYIKNHVSEALKIYSLAVNYKFNDNFILTLGRKINRNLSNVGVIDGIQLEGKFNNFTAGLLLGSRPDYLHYTFNPNLLEFGGFINHSFLLNFGAINNTLSLFQQTNNSRIDRRFLYFQHSSSFVKQLNLFLSAEVDLYKRENTLEKSDFSLTGLFASVRYRPSRLISFQTSYDARKNVIYYETFQNYTDSLFTNVIRKGLRFRVSIRPLNRLYVNLSYGYRFRNGDVRNSENYSGRISYSNLPFVAGTFSVSYNHLTTSYLDGDIFGAKYSRDILEGFLYGNFSTRYVKYAFANMMDDLNQILFGFDLSWRIMRHLSFSANYEGTFEVDRNYSRIYFNITKRF